MNKKYQFRSKYRTKLHTQRKIDSKEDIAILRTLTKSITLFIWNVIQFKSFTFKYLLKYNRAQIYRQLYGFMLKLTKHVQSHFSTFLQKS